MKKRFLLLLTAALLTGMLCGCQQNPTGTTTPMPGTSTVAAEEPELWQVDSLSSVAFDPLQRISAMGNHFIESDEDLEIMHLMLPPLAKEVVVDTKTGEVQWVFLAATDIQDVTKDNQDDLTRYQVTLPRGKTAEEIEGGYVYEIKLRPEMCWADGTAITADDYLYSMKALLDPERKYSAASYGPYCSGSSALAGGYAYFAVGKPRLVRMVPLYDEGETPVYAYDLQTEIAAGHVYLDLFTGGMALYPLGFNLPGMLASDGTKLFNELKKGYSEEQIPITPENYETLKAVIADAVENTLEMDWDTLDQTRQEQLIMEALWIHDETGYPPVSFDTVGLYKVDDYTIRYVCQESCEYETFLYLTRENWLVHQSTYEASLEEDALYSYSWSALSCGPYQVDYEASEALKRIVLIQNENYWGYTRNADGSLSAMTPYLVDGAQQPQYEAHQIVVEERGR